MDKSSIPIFWDNAEAQWEVFRVEFIGVSMVLLRNVCLAVYFEYFGNKKMSFLIEFVTLVFPMLFCLTILAEYLNELIGGMFFLTISLMLFQKSKGRQMFYVSRSTDYLSTFRNAIFVGTACAILAVDFGVFPHRFAKTSSYGFSVMDIGTSMFVFLIAISEYNQSEKSQPTKSSKKKWTLSLSNIPMFMILLGIGFLRELFTHLFNYNHSVSEYGQHWNFFMTLGFLKLFTTILPYPYSVFPGLVIGVSYQTALNFGLEQWIVRRGRDLDNVFDANREGICSLLGYIFSYSLTLVWVKLVSIINGITNPSKKSVMVNMAFGIFFFILQIHSMELYGYPSRRVSNMPYVLAQLSMEIMIIAFSQLYQLLGSSEIEIHHPKQEESLSLRESISRNCLLFFLMANLGTGIVNMSIDTHQVQCSYTQMLILISYCFVICSIIYLYNSFKNRRTIAHVQISNVVMKK